MILHYILVDCQGKMDEKLNLAVSNFPIIYVMSLYTYGGTCHADSEPEWFRQPRWTGACAFAVDK